MTERLDDEKLETLRSWGAGLATEGRDELRAAGKAILILIEEIDRLQVDVWRARQESPAATDVEHARDSAETKPALESSLRLRLRGLMGKPTPKGA